jgi:hypothetical protein
MSAGPGAPGDRPPGDEPLGGEAKKLKDKQVAVVIPGLSMEELLKYGVLPVILPPGMLKKKLTTRKNPPYIGSESYSTPREDGLPNCFGHCPVKETVGPAIGPPIQPNFANADSNDSSSGSSSNDAPVIDNDAIENPSPGESSSSGHSSLSPSSSSDQENEEPPPRAA